jgi:hypothetical protein
MTMKTTPISRRSLAAGLALAPVAGLPALAGAVSADDPVLAALTALEQTEAWARKILDAHDAAEEAFYDSAPPRLPLVVDGIPCDDHAAIDAHFDYPGMPEENIDNAIALLESYRKSPLTDEQQAEREDARRKAHEELDAIIAARAKAKAGTGWADFEEPYQGSLDAHCEAERKILATKPTSQAGAVALLRYAAQYLRDNSDRGGIANDAIRAAAGFFEGRA